jgi:hypothetical protein
MMRDSRNESESGRSSRRAWLARSARALAAAPFAALAGCRHAGRYGLETGFGVLPPRDGRAVVLLRFGGGVRQRDVFGPEAECLAPALRALASRSTIFTDVVNEHHTRHDSATLYMLTGRYGERGSDPAANREELAGAALVHEVFRRQTGRPQHKALVLGAPTFSAHPLHGSTYRAASFATYRATAENVPPGEDPSLPPCVERDTANSRLFRLARELSATDAARNAEVRRRKITESVAADLEADAPPSPAITPALATALERRLLDRREFIRESEADEWQTDLALLAMESVRPDFVFVGYRTPDVAHRGSWREYAAAVRALDLEVRRIADFVATDIYYRDRTLLLVAPDVGRGDTDFTAHEPAATGTEDPAARRTFLVASGKGVTAGRVIADRRPQVAIATTIASALEVTIGQAESAPLTEVLA